MSRRVALAAAAVLVAAVAVAVAGPRPGGSAPAVVVASPSEAVLDHYELEGRRVADHGWRLEPAGTPRLASLPLVATEVGRRTLVAGDRRLPLFEPGAAPAHLVLSVRR